MIEELTALVKVVGATKLALSAFLSIALAYIAVRFFTNASDRIKLFVFFAMLLFSFALIILLFYFTTDDDGVDRDTDLERTEIEETFKKRLDIIREIQEEKREELCNSIWEKNSCVMILNTLEGIPPRVSESASLKVESDLKAGNPDSVEISSIVEPSAQLSDQILAADKPDHWRIDIFWCQGGQENQKYGLALKMAESLADYSNSDTLLDEQLPLGRVRVRKLSLTKQGSGYPSSGLLIRPENKDHEIHAARTISNFLQSKFSKNILLGRSNTKTDGYLSLFVCS